MLIASPKEYKIARLLSRFFIWGKRRARGLVFAECDTNRSLRANPPGADAKTPHVGEARKSEVAERFGG